MSKTNNLKSIESNRERIKNDFPILSKKVNDSKLVYLDSAATSLTPKQVVHAINDYYNNYNANIHRGIHSLAEQATYFYEKAHDKVATMINAAEDREVVFTKNATEALNLAASGLTASLDIGKGDNVVLTQMEHHSNLVPWQRLSKEKGFELRFVEVDSDGKLNLDSYKELLDENTKVVSVVHASNFLGTINPVKQMAEMAHDKGAVFVVDAAQSVPHMPVDVQELGVDFMAFSGHKMLGPTGTGVLYGKERLLKNLKPELYGGGMVQEVSYEEADFQELPWKFEAGTQNLAGGIGLGAAVDYMELFDMKDVLKHGQELARECIEMLEEIGAEVYGPPADERIGLVAFNLEGVHPHDVSSILDEYGVAIRGGHHCVMPLHEKMDVETSCRASFQVYNTKEDIEALRKGLEKVKEVFK